jgi:hypothetical protein
MSLAFAPMPAYATLTSEEQCDLAESNGVAARAGQSDFELYLKYPKVTDKPTSADLATYIQQVKKSITWFNKWGPGCKDQKALNLGRAGISDAKLIIARLQGSEWLPFMNLALQQYTRCESDYFGEKKGADCQTRAEELIGYKVKWQQPEPEPSSE